MFTLRLLHSCPRSCTVCAADGVKIASGSGKRTECWKTRPSTGNTRCTHVTFVADVGTPWLHGLARLAVSSGIFRDTTEQLGASLLGRVTACCCPCHVRLLAGIFTSQSLHFTVKDLLELDCQWLRVILAIHLL